MLFETAAPEDVVLVIMFRVLEPEIEMFNVLDAVLVLPIVSVTASAGIDTIPLPSVAPDGVKVMVRTVPEVVRAESVPRVALKSESERSLTSSLSVMVIEQAVPEA